MLTGLPFIITEDIDPTNAQKAEKFKEYAASLNATQKTELYTQILSAPSQNIWNRRWRVSYKSTPRENL